MGKGTLVRKLIEAHPDTFTLAVSHTTRSPRPGEVDGVDYHFVSNTEFAALVAQDAFIEHTTFSGAMYGTSKRTVIDQTAEGKGRIILLDIDLEGVKQIKASPDIPTARFVFVRPPNPQVLETRLRSRGTEGEEDIRRRLEQARDDLCYVEATAGLHDLVIVNDDVDRAYRELEVFIFGPSP
ncbi:guanylate kinase [Candidatus Bathyarchaeota archaeon]|nr:guanylate kinase [Candidatus Bathyarchaeota archaeon]